MPAEYNFFILEYDSVAGPIVQIIFVLLNFILKHGIVQKKNNKAKKTGPAGPVFLI